MKWILIALILVPVQLLHATEERIVLGAGCFWCIEPPFKKLKDEGVLSTRVGYAGGHVENPTYEQVSQGDTGHIEVIEVVFDSQKIDRQKILEIFWRNIDPFNQKGQFCDLGTPYLSAIFFTSDEQEKAALASRKWAQDWLKEQGRLEGKIATVIRPLNEFYPAEDYHQNYAEKNPLRYKYYRYRCGRDARLETLWSSP